MKLSEITSGPIEKFQDFLGTNLKFELFDHNDNSYSTKEYSPGTNVGTNDHYLKPINKLFRVVNNKIQIPGKYHEFYITAQGRNGEWKFPWELFDVEDMADEVTFFIDAAQGQITFSSFEQLPNVKEIVFKGNCEITSFAGIEKMTRLEDIQFAAFGEPACGVLRLFKASALIRFGVAHNTHDDLQTMSRIVTSHLKGDRSIPECQQELVEAGLKRFAKL